jgi:desulfoferrodoxin-like iron-binding protein
MKKPFLFFLLLVFVAAGAILSLAAQTSATAEQKEPYTATSFGPWNAGVAAKHVPQVTFEKMGKGLKVTVQIDNHPMDPQKPHWIMWIRLEDMKGNKLGEKTFQATDPGPAIAVFELPAMHTKLKALERCNIHGVWLNELTVKF